MAFRQKKQKKATGHYNEIDYHRHSSDRVAPLTSGGRTAPWTIRETVTITTKDGMKYEIPVDKKGRVPKEALYERFLDVNHGTRSSKRRNVKIDVLNPAGMVHDYPEGGFTPDELIETGWWQYPNESDIYTIDDPSAAESVALALRGAPMSAKDVGRMIVFIMPKPSADRARDVLAKNFTAAELKAAVKNGGIIITEQPLGRGIAGEYRGVFAGSSNKTPTIALKPGWDEDTLVHEFTHHLRHRDLTRTGMTKTPFPVNDKGERTDYYLGDYSGGAREFNSRRNLEEAATVAEAATRTRKPAAFPSGYYDHTSAHGKDPYERYGHDRKLLAGDGPLKGKRAQKRVRDRFDDTSISHLRVYTPGENAMACYKELANYEITAKPMKKGATVAKTSAARRTAAARKPASKRKASKGARR